MTCPRSRDTQVPGLQIIPTIIQLTQPPLLPCSQHSAPTRSSQCLSKHLPQPLFARMRPLLLSWLSPIAETLCWWSRGLFMQEKGPQRRMADAPREEELAYSSLGLPELVSIPPDELRKRPAGLMASWRLLSLLPQFCWLKAPSPPSSSSAWLCFWKMRRRARTC